LAFLSALKTRVSDHIKSEFGGRTDIWVTPDFGLGDTTMEILVEMWINGNLIVSYGI